MGNTRSRDRKIYQQFVADPNSVRWFHTQFQPKTGETEDQYVERCHSMRMRQIAKQHAHFAAAAHDLAHHSAMRQHGMHGHHSMHDIHGHHGFIHHAHHAGMGHHHHAGV